jgi:hypothetical protein
LEIQWKQKGAKRTKKAKTFLSFLPFLLFLLPVTFSCNPQRIYGAMYLAGCLDVQSANNRLIVVGGDPIWLSLVGIAASFHIRSDFQIARDRLIVVRGDSLVPTPRFYMRFDFHRCLLLLRKYVINCGDIRHSPIQAKKKREIAGWENCFSDLRAEKAECETNS